MSPVQRGGPVNEQRKMFVGEKELLQGYSIIYTCLEGIEESKSDNEEENKVSPETKKGISDT
jgi:hypothetical protein